MSSTETHRAFSAGPTWTSKRLTSAASGTPAPPSSGASSLRHLLAVPSHGGPDRVALVTASGVGPIFTSGPAEPPPPLQAARRRQARSALMGPESTRQPPDRPAGPTVDRGLPGV